MCFSTKLVQFSNNPTSSLNISEPCFPPGGFTLQSLDDVFVDFLLWILTQSINSWV